MERKFVGTERDLKEVTPAMVEEYETLWELSRQFMRVGVIDKAIYYMSEASEVANIHMLMVIDIKGIQKYE